MKLKPSVPVAIAISFLAGAVVMIAIDVYDGVRVPKSRIENRESKIQATEPCSSPTPEPHLNTTDNAINRFGVSPLYPQWFELTRKDGEPLTSFPAPDQAVFTFPAEPVIEKVDPPKERSWDRPTWKVTFKP